MELLRWLEDTNVSVWMRESDWGIPIMLCFHAVGMGIVVGVSFMFGARILGYSKHFPLAGFDTLFRLAWLGFIMNAASGTLMFIGEPRRLLQTPAFIIKMALIVCAGFALWALSKALEGGAEPGVGIPRPVGLPGSDGTLTAEQPITRAAKIAAVVTIVFWLGAILSGRLIGYTIGPPPL
jgi:hypothetical protein